jgi:hypothetical protein
MTSIIMWISFCFNKKIWFAFCFCYSYIWVFLLVYVAVQGLVSVQFPRVSPRARQFPAGAVAVWQVESDFVCLRFRPVREQARHHGLDSCRWFFILLARSSALISRTGRATRASSRAVGSVRSWADTRPGIGFPVLDFAVEFAVLCRKVSISSVSHSHCQERARGAESFPFCLRFALGFLVAVLFCCFSRSCACRAQSLIAADQLVVPSACIFMPFVIILLPRTVISWFSSILIEGACRKKSILFLSHQIKD